MRPNRLAAVAAATMLTLLVAPAPERAEACTPFTNSPHTGDPIPGDVTPPSVVTVSGFEVERHWAGPGDTCIDMAWVRIAVSATDDQAPVGYVLEVAAGEPPWGLSVPPGPVRPYPGSPNLYLYFTPEDYLFAFELHIRAVDLNGNYGPRATVSIWDDEPQPGSPDDGGCSTRRGRHPGAAAVATALLLLVALARRRARSPRRPR